MERWIYGDDIDLPKCGVGVGGGVDPCPTESGECAIDVMQTKTIGVEPVGGHLCLDPFRGFTALLRVPVERPVVHREKLLDVGWRERAGSNPRSRCGQRHAHLQQGSLRRPPGSCHEFGPLIV